MMGVIDNNDDVDNTNNDDFDGDTNCDDNNVEEL
jgi:hypothetical protein